MMERTTAASFSESCRTVSVSLITPALTGFTPQRLDLGEIGLDRDLPLDGVGLEQLARRLVIDDDEVADFRLGAREQRAHVVGRGEPVGFAGLRHDVAYVHLDRARGFDLARDAVDQQVREDRRVEGTGSEHDRIRFADRGDHFVGRPCERRIEEDPFDRLGGPGDVRFTLDRRPVDERCAEGG